jgi:hypothetical protein
MGVLADPHVDTDALLGVIGWFGWFTVHFDAEGDEPLARRFLLVLEEDTLSRQG